MRNNNQKYRDLATGIGKRLSNVTTITLNNAPLAPKDLVDLFQRCASAGEASLPLHAAWQSQVKVARELQAKAQPVLVAFIAWAHATYGREPAILQEFGLKPRKPRTVKPAVKAQAASKAKATRTARHTMGPQQRRAVKGEVATKPATPATAGATTSVAAPATPAASGASPVLVR